MNAFRNLVLLLFLLIFLAGNTVACQIESGSFRHINVNKSPESVPVSTIENPTGLIFLAIEVNPVTQSISEVHKLSSVLELMNSYLPAGYPLSGLTKAKNSGRFVSAIPIFIKGHALRH